MFSAREFVWWYNGHPDAADLPVDLTRVKAAAVCGIGGWAQGAGGYMQGAVPLVGALWGAWWWCGWVLMGEAGRQEAV